MYVIELLTEASSQDISNLVVRLDSHLVIMQLTNHYHIHNLILLCCVLRVRILELQIEFITYEHIPIESNALVDSLSNYVLD